MIIRNKFNGYGFDGARLYHDPVSLSIAATQAGVASSAAATAAAAAAAAPAVVAPTLAATGTAAAQTAGLELAKQQAIQAGMQQMGTEAAKQVGLEAVKQQAGTEIAKQGLAQAGQQTGVEAAKQGIFSANPAGTPPTAGAPITPPTGPVNPAAPLNPAGGPPPQMTLEQQLAQIKNNPTDLSKFPQYEQVATGPGGQTQLVEKAAADPYKNAGFSKDYLGGETFNPGFKGLDATSVTNSPSLTAPPANQGINMTPDLASKFGAPPEPNALQKGFETGLQYVKDNPISTGLGLMTAGQYMNQPEEEDKDKYKNTVDMSEFKPTIPSQPSFTRSYEYQKYAVGGPVEQMAAMNAVGANTGYPQAGLQTPMYSNPAMQRPQATNVVAPSVDAGVGTYTGEPRFAEGGLSAAERREYGLQNRSQRASRNLSKSYEEMEEQRQKEAMRLFGERSDPGIVPRSRTQMLSSPFSAAMTEHARLAKKSKVPVAQMPKTNLGDIDTYMDIPIEAAGGGIMHGAQRYAKGGETQYGRPVRAADFATNAVNSENYRRAELAGGRRPAAPTAPVMSAPKYTTPAQQTPYTPVSYQDNSSYQMPQPQQQSDMDDFYGYMNQQLGNYGFAEGGIMHGLGGYSDGGRLLRGPGDGVSDSIPAVIGKRQPARLADGEFVIPARIVSELGNGSTEAGARKLYAMMERVQASRKKSIGKKKVAVNSKADKHLPA